jgi:hypothetical protein
LGTALIALAACGDNIHEGDHLSPFFHWKDQTRVGAAEIDTLDDSTDTPMLQMMPKPRHPDSVVMLYGHVPGQTVSFDLLENLLANAQADGLAFFTFADLAAGGDPRPGLCLSFDDDSVDAWFGLGDLFAKYGAKASFFVTRYDGLTPTQKDELHALAAAGNSIEAHGKNHIHGIDYVTAHGIEAYLDDEVIPSIEVLRADGFDPVAFAYPYGERTNEMDDAVTEHIQLVRGISGTPH